MNITQDLLTQEYIEVIRDLEKKNRVARVKDIARARGVTCANVSVAMSNLAKKELINHEQYGHIVLTASGRRLARNLDKRHMAIKKFLMDVLGLQAELAESEACKLEHVMSPESMHAIGNFLLFVDKCPKRDRKNAVLFRTCGLYSPNESTCQECARDLTETENSDAHTF
jgi:DtxR family transcriptional regulator, Mn-dependent transcriptional regulator